MQPKRPPLEKLQQSWQTAFNTENRAFTLDVLKVLISAFGVLATVFAGVGLYLTYRTSQAQLESAQQERQLNSERLVTDRFAKAVEQLGSPDIDVRIGGIYSLERIAKDSPKDHWTIMEVLTAFVRNRSKLPKDWKPNLKQELPKVTIDVQSALTAIGRRERKHDPEGQRLDLSSTNLRSAELWSADLGGANLSGADLGEANLKGANLKSAFLGGTNLEGAYFENCNLTDATLMFSNLKNAYLFSALLSGAFLWGTNLRGAKLEGADLWNARLKKAQNLTPAQAKTAKNWAKAHYDPDFRQELGLPPEKP